MTAQLSAQSFAYEKKGNSAVIWRCFSRDMKAEIPEEIQGLRVTEIAPYAFSAHMDERTLERGISEGKIKIFTPEAMGTLGTLPPALCGTDLEEVVIPAGVTRMGRYCFYNCEKLRKLTFSGTLGDWGTGVFTGCHKVRDLCVRISQSGVSFLKGVLDELPEELRVEYLVEPVYNENGEVISDSGHAHLVFPEFFEEGIENTPARILEVRYHGMGLHYRNCFKNRVFDFRQYDNTRLFELAITQEPAETMAEMAMNRLRYPYQLSDSAAETYRKHIQLHGRDLINLLLERRDMAGIRWLLETAGNDQALTDELTEKASKKQFTEALSYLMEFCRETTKPVKRRRQL